MNIRLPTVRNLSASPSSIDRAENRSYEWANDIPSSTTGGCMRMKCLWAAALMLCAVPALAQTRTVTGTITDAQSGQPIEGVRVLIRGTTNGATTAANGKFTLRTAPEGAVTITVRRIGYQPATVSVAAG